MTLVYIDVIINHMIHIQHVTATETRNNFFNILKNSYLKGITYVIKKDDVPMARLIPETLVQNIISKKTLPLSSISGKLTKGPKNLAIDVDRIYQ